MASVSSEKFPKRVTRRHVKGITWDEEIVEIVHILQQLVRSGSCRPYVRLHTQLY